MFLDNNIASKVLQELCAEASQRLGGAVTSEIAVDALLISMQLLELLEVLDEARPTGLSGLVYRANKSFIISSCKVSNI